MQRYVRNFNNLELQIYRTYRRLSDDNLTMECIPCNEAIIEGVDTASWLRCQGPNDSPST